MKRIALAAVGLVVVLGAATGILVRSRSAHERDHPGTPGDHVRTSGQISPPDPPSEARRAELAPAHGAAISFEVVALEGGSPIEGVLIHYRSGIEWSSIATNCQGYAHVQVPPDTRVEYAVERRKARIRPEMGWHVQAPAVGQTVVERVELPLRQEDVLYGVVMDASTGAPVPNARLTIEHPPLRLSSESPSTSDERYLLSGEDGAFSLLMPGWEMTAIICDADGYALWTQLLNSEHSSPQTALVARLDRSCGLDLRVRDSAGDPIQGATVRVSCGPEHLLGGMDGRPVEIRAAPWESATDESGRAVLSRLPPYVPLDLSIHRDGVTRREAVTLEPGEARQLPIELFGKSRLNGRIEDTAGRPIQDVAIWLIKASAAAPARYLTPDEIPEYELVSDRDGCIAANDLRPGFWWIGPAPTPHPKLGRISAVAEIIQVSERSDHRIIVDPHSVDVRVVGPYGEPAANSIVVVTSFSPRGTWHVAADKHGSCKVGPLSKGTLELEARSAFFEFGPSFVETVDSSSALVTLRLRHSGSIQGNLDGWNVGQGTVLLQAIPEGDSRSPWTSFWVTGAGEQFSLGGLAPGQYTFSCQTKERFVRLTAVPVSEGRVTDLGSLSFEPSGVVRVLIARPSDHRAIRIYQLDRLVGGTQGPPLEPASRFRVPCGPTRVELSSWEGDEMAQHLNVQESIEAVLRF